MGGTLGEAFAMRGHDVCVDEPPRIAADPIFFSIRARGFPRPESSRWLGGMCVTVAWAAALPTIELVGSFMDQSALDGFLTMLNELELPVLSVERLPEW
jgi:hypothetical protein